MSFSKYMKYTTLSVVGFIAGAEFYYQCSTWLRQKLQLEDEGDINEIIYTRGDGNYNTRLTRNITFVREPAQHATEVIVNLILSAQESIHVAMYIFTSDPLARALIAARSKGVDVKCVVDASMENANSSKMRLLHKSGIPLKVHDAKTLHLKLCVIDVPFGKNKKKVSQSDRNFDIPIVIPPNGVVITGSLNWTREALMSNEENIIVSSNSELCQNSAKKFHEMWKDSRLY